MQNSPPTLLVDGKNALFGFYDDGKLSISHSDRGYFTQKDWKKVTAANHSGFWLNPTFIYENILVSSRCSVNFLTAKSLALYLTQKPVLTLTENELRYKKYLKSFEAIIFSNINWLKDGSRFYKKPNKYISKKNVRLYGINKLNYGSNIKPWYQLNFKLLELNLPPKVPSLIITPCHKLWGEGLSNFSMFLTHNNLRKDKAMVIKNYKNNFTISKFIDWEGRRPWS